MNNDNYALHAVIIKKVDNITQSIAKEIASKFIDKKQFFMRETNASYRFRNIPKTKFIKSSFRTKKINNYISLVFGELLVSGKGLKKFISKKIDRLKDIFSPRLDDYSNKAKRAIEKYGNNKIIGMQIYRTPLDSIINKTINTISFGQWNELQKKYGFDKFYHLALVLTLDNNKNIIVQKLDVIDVDDSYKTTSKTETFNITGYAPNTKTLNDLLTSARSKLNDDKLWFGYDPLYNNCQYFIRYILQNNDLYNDEINKFLFQDLTELIGDLTKTKTGYLTSKIMKFTTDLSATANKLLGKGEPKNKIHYYKKQLFNLNKKINNTTDINILKSYEDKLIKIENNLIKLKNKNKI
jgi:hypothetical protein